MASAAVRRHISAVLIDLSGTIHVEDLAIKGAQEALLRLQASGVKIKFVTNTTKHCKRVLHDQLKTLGFNIDKSELYTTLTGVRQVIESRGLRPLLYVAESAKEDFEGLDTENPNSVVVGLAPEYFNYGSMNKAFELLLTGAPLIATHKSRYYKRKDGIHLGPGAFITGLEFASSSKAEVIGKPEPSFFKGALDSLNHGFEGAVVIGDDVRDDVKGAMDVGMMGILVKTGKYLDGDEHKIEPPPTAVCDDFPAAVEFILQNLQPAGL